jgi:hypothetical protein
LFKAFTQKKIASCKVQKWWLIQVQIRRSESAVVIQTKFRMFYYWRFFHKQKRSSALIQGSWRAFQCQKKSQTQCCDVYSKHLPSVAATK